MKASGIAILVALALVVASNGQVWAQPTVPGQPKIFMNAGRGGSGRDYPPRRSKKGDPPPMETIAQKATVLQEHAAKAMEAGNWSQAEEDCRQALALSPSPVRCWSLMGAARLNQANYKGARDAFEVAVRIDVDDVTTIGQLGVTLVRLSQPDEAVKWLDVLRERLAACGEQCVNRTAIQAGISEIETALAPKA